MATFDEFGNPVPDQTTNTSSPGVTQSGVGGFLQGVGQFLTGSNNPLTNASLVPAMTAAFKQWHDAGTYRDLGNQAAQVANPFGPYRQQYADELSALYKDPSQIENTPGYKFALNQALDSTSSRLASQGFLGSSQMQSALASQASGLAQQTWNTEADRLARLAGAQFDPASAASMMMRGGELAVNSQNAALGDLFYPFGPGANGSNGVTVNNNNSANGGQGSGSGNGGGGAGGLPGTALQWAAAHSGPGGIIPGAGTVANLWQHYLSDPGSISQGDLQILQDAGLLTGANSAGGMDYASGGYDPSGFGGYGDATGDPTLQGINFGGNFDPSNYNDVMGNTGFDSGTYGDTSGIDMTGFQTSMDNLWGG